MRKCLWLYLLLVLPLVVVGCKGMKGGDPDADACAACGACGDACSDASACGGCGEGCGCGDAEAGAMLQDGDAEEDFDLDRISEDMLAEKERIGALKTRLVALAERARNSGQLVQAREIYRKVVQLDPGDATARDALFRLSEELGERGATAEGILEGASTREGARREQVAEMIRNRITKARVAEDENDYDEAIRNYQEIINLLGWYPYQADLPVDEGGARALLDEARKRKELYDERRSAALRRQVQAEEEERRRRAQTETADQIRTFLRLASDAYDAGNYILAINYAERVRALDPRNEAAINLVKIAKETKYVADSNATKEHFAHEWKLIMERLELSAIPQSDIMRFPRNWSMIASRTARTGVGMDDSAAEDPRTQQILNVLETRRVGELSLKPGEITLEGAVEYLRSVTGENFVISQKVRDEKSDIELDLEVKDVTVAQVLNLITEPHDMAWKIRNGVVMVLDISEATEDLILQFFDVKDLVARISDFPGEEINLFPSKYTPPEPDEGDEPEPPFNADQLIELVRNTIEPESWDAIEGVAIEAKNNILVIKTTREIQRKVGALLDDLRKHTGILINIEVRFLDAEDRFLRDVGVDMRGLGDQTGGVGIPGKGSAPNFDDSFVGTTANPAGTGQGVIPEPSSIGTSPIPGAFFGDGTDGTYQGRVENLFDMILQFREPGQATQSAQQGGLRGANAGGFTLQTTFIDDVQFEVILRAVRKRERS
ncbi:MAG: hypothetical protein ACE10D_04055, partial [Planctomycetota bacterium]